MPLSHAEVRLLAARDSIEALTALIRQAYEPLAAGGQRWPEAAQSAAVTGRRVAQGQCFIAELRGRIVGTLTVSRPQDLHDEPGTGPAFRDRDTAHLHQFAVAPDLQHQGLGRRLLAACEHWARERGYRRMALDLGADATELRAMYRRLGYSEVAEQTAAPSSSRRGSGSSGPLGAPPWGGGAEGAPGGVVVTMEKALDQSPLRQQLQLLARYNLWAARELQRHVDGLPEADYRRDAGLFFKSVHGTLNHLLLAEQDVWLRRFTEGASSVTALDLEIEPDRAALRERLADAALAWLPLIEIWPEARLLGKLSYRRVNGEAATLPFAAALIHVFNHATHHRGQITAALTALGRPAPELDLALMLLQDSTG